MGLIENILKYQRFENEIDKKDHIRHSLWSTLIIFNSIMISSFSIILSIKPIDSPFLIISYFIIVFTPIILSLYNFYLSYKYQNIQALKTAIKIIKLFPEDFPNYKGEAENKDKKYDSAYFKKANKRISFRENLSLVMSIIVFFYFLIFLWKVNFQ